MKLAAGGEAVEREARRMVAEKIEAPSACKRWLSRAAWERHRKVRPENRSRITGAGCVPTGGGWLRMSVRFAAAEGEDLTLCQSDAIRASDASDMGSEVMLLALTIA
jgi:hypothetical protein